MSDGGPTHDRFVDKSSTNGDPAKPKVLIVGAGIAGLTLGILLHKANIPFEIFERCFEIKPYGSGIVMGADLAPLFRQLGFYEEFLKIGKPVANMAYYNASLKPASVVDYSEAQCLGGAQQYTVSRSELYELLWRQLPPESVHLGKRVFSYHQDDEKVVIRFMDGTKYYGHVIVGADGAYSVVREQLFLYLNYKDKLKTSEDTIDPFSSVCLVGQTEVLDPNEFPSLKHEFSETATIQGLSSLCTWQTFVTKKNTICWMVNRTLTKRLCKDDSDTYYPTEWGLEKPEDMCKEVRDLKVPGGKDGKVLTLGDYIDRTPTNMLAKLHWEERLYFTWYGGRTVLIGDACHKMNPCEGSSTLSAIHDAVAIANWLNTVRSPSVTDLNIAFKEYKAERYPIAKDAFDSSQALASKLTKNVNSSKVRSLVKRIPSWPSKRDISKTIAARPQAAFLPLVQDDGQLKPVYQPSLHKSKEVLRQQEIDQEFEALAIR
ncbi:hypothetical protein BGZ81_003347 [Podila clonocystis]|nr:hypothetical protein BGZ81_003347 [Podila clonocystis]